MSKRFYLSKVMGNGDEAEPEYDENGFDITPTVGYRRHGINQPAYNQYWKRVSEIEPMANGAWPSHVMCVLDMPDHTIPRADPQMFWLPVAEFNTKCSALDSVARQQLYDAILIAGLSGTILNSTTIGYGAVLQMIGQKLYPGFDINKVEVQ